MTTLLKIENLQHILQKALLYLKEKAQFGPVLSPEAESIILQYSNGDGRRLLNLIEIIFQTNPEGTAIDETQVLDIIQNKIASYDRTGDDLIKGDTAEITGRKIEKSITY